MESRSRREALVRDEAVVVGEERMDSPPDGVS